MEARQAEFLGLGAMRRWGLPLALLLGFIGACDSGATNQGTPSEAAPVPSNSATATPTPSAGPATTQPSAPPTPTPTTATTTTTTTNGDPVAECFQRPPIYNDDILYRSKDPGVDWSTQRLGSGWVWNHVTNSCQTSVDWLIATTPSQEGSCGEVAKASDNPNYDIEASPAPPLRHVLAAKGTCR